MTTPFDERLDQCLIHLFPQRQYLLSNEAIQAKAALLSLFREMVEEGKPPEQPSAGDEPPSYRVGVMDGFNIGIEEYEENLLRQLGEKK